MEDVKQSCSADPAGITREKKAWHMPAVRVSSVPGITANAHSAHVEDRFLRPGLRFLSSSFPAILRNL